MYNGLLNRCLLKEDAWKSIPSRVLKYAESHR